MINSLHVVVKNVSVLWFWVKRRSRSVPEFSRHRAALAALGFPAAVAFVCRALGVTLWELFENGAQPYPHLSDREVLNHVIKDQQIKLFKPQLELPYSERW